LILLGASNSRGLCRPSLFLALATGFTMQGQVGCEAQAVHLLAASVKKSSWTAPEPQ
jgi:hypothetical protein